MRNKSRTCSTGVRRAMTLIEVVAGLALLATVLSGIVAIKTRCLRQMHRTEQRREAIRCADELLSAWWTDTATFPYRSSGPVPGHPQLQWRTRPISNLQAQSLGGQVIRLEIADFSASSSAEPLISVEVLLPRQVQHAIGIHTD